MRVMILPPENNASEIAGQLTELGGLSLKMPTDLARRRWTRNELIRAFNLYCQIPFGTIHIRNPQIIDLAASLGRTPSAVSWKLANFARLDPTLAKRQIRGASHGSKEDELIWREFEADWDSLAFESERLRLGEAALPALATEYEFPEGTTRDAVVKARVNQGFFRKAVLNAYNVTCCVTGIKVAELLCASHIVPWSVDLKNRTNPSNGLCLNAFHDRAFDRGLMTISFDFEIVLSPKVAKLEEKHLRTMLLDFGGAKIAMPQHFIPSADFLSHHNKHVFQG
jgi:putative restriction endonuclease